MPITTKIKLLTEDLNDLEKLIEIDSKLVEKYPNDNLLRITLQQYLDRKKRLETSLLLQKTFNLIQIKDKILPTIALTKNN